MRLEDTPTFLNFGSERGRTIYGEDMFVGYHFYEQTKKSVLFPFGHGLSYTDFAIDELQVNTSQMQDTLNVSLACEIVDVVTAPILLKFMFHNARLLSFGRLKNSRALPRYFFRKVSRKHCRFQLVSNMRQDLGRAKELLGDRERNIRCPR